MREFLIMVRDFNYPAISRNRNLAMYCKALNLGLVVSPDGYKLELTEKGHKFLELSADEYQRKLPNSNR